MYTQREQKRMYVAQKGLNFKIYIVIGGNGRLINLKITAWITADCSVVLDLIKTIKLGALFGDRAYDTNSIINYTEKLGINIVIMSKFNRKPKWNFDSNLYRLRHIIKNTFLKFTNWRNIDTCYFKTFIALRAFFCLFCFSVSASR